MHGHFRICNFCYVVAFCHQMLPSVKFAEDKVPTLLILREKCYNSATWV